VNTKTSDVETNLRKQILILAFNQGGPVDAANGETGARIVAGAGTETVLRCPSRRPTKTSVTPTDSPPIFWFHCNRNLLSSSYALRHNKLERLFLTS
jgi:hypothetical protein